MYLNQLLTVLVIAAFVGPSLAIAQKRPDGETGDPPLSPTMQQVQNQTGAKTATKDKEILTTEQARKIRDRANASTRDPPELGDGTKERTEAKKKNGSTGDPPESKGGIAK